MEEIVAEKCKFGILSFSQPLLMVKCQFNLQLAKKGSVWHKLSLYLNVELNEESAQRDVSYYRKLCGQIGAAEKV